MRALLYSFSVTRIPNMADIINVLLHTVSTCNWERITSIFCLEVGVLLSSKNLFMYNLAQALVAMVSWYGSKQATIEQFFHLIPLKEIANFHVIWRNKHKNGLMSYHPVIFLPGFHDWSWLLVERKCQDGDRLRFAHLRFLHLSFTFMYLQLFSSYLKPSMSISMRHSTWALMFWVLIVT